jgi:sterol 3beta-glucosyltransferase
VNIAITASGSRGDVQPYVALGKGLKAAGHDVRVLTSEDFQSLVEDAGLQFVSVGTSIEAMLQQDEWRNVIESGNFIAIMSRMSKEMKSRAAGLAEILPALFEHTDLIVAGAGGLGALSISEKLNIPMIQLHVFPITPTSRFPSPLTPSLPFGSLLNRTSFHIMRFMLWQTGRVGEATLRRKLRMSPPSFWGPYAAMEKRGIPTLYGFSQHVIPRPDDWGASSQVAGYWFLDPADDWAPPAETVAFLNAGSPPVYIGFGSMANRNPQEAGLLALEALERSGQRGIIASGWGGFAADDLPDTVHMISAMPHSWLFPRMAAVVHHGGAGTTSAGLRAGIPSVVVPFMGDQPFWGKRVYDLGVGPAPIPRKKLTAERLAAAIIEATVDDTMRQRAAELGTQIRSEDGVAEGVAQISRFIEEL